MNKRSVNRECHRCACYFVGKDADEQLAAHACDPLLVLADGCAGDSDGLRAALGVGFVVVYESLSNEGWGHHSYDQIFRTADGRFVHAECGGCSCEGNGSWSVLESEAAAMLLVPEHKRPA